MMKKTRIMLAVLAAVVAMTFAGCEAVEAAFKDALYSINGKVVNIKSSTTGNFYATKDGTQSLVGSEVVFTNISTGATYTAAVGSSGTYSIADVPNGKYTVIATKAGWAFIPNSSFTVTYSTTSVPDIRGFYSNDGSALTVALTWDNTNTDLDLHMTYGAVPATTNHLQSTELAAGADTKSGTGWTAELDRDVFGPLLTTTPLVETITLKATGTMTPNDGNNYNDPEDVNEDNTFRFYVDAFPKAGNTAQVNNAALTGNNSLTPAALPAGASVHVFKAGTHLGSFYVPFNTAERTLRILKVAFDNSATPDFTVFTDIQTTAPGIFRSLGLSKIGLPVSAIE